MMTLYVAPGSCSLASHIALEEAGADYRAARVDLAGGEQRSDAYRALNPKGRVPALVTERGVLTENPAILAFVAQSFPKARLAPLDDPFAFARAQSFNAYLASTVHVAFAHGKRGSRWADDPAAIAEMTRKTPEVFAACFADIERDMLAGPWVMGETYTICDPYLFTFAGWLAVLGIDIGRFPKVADHARRVAARPAVARVLASLA